MFVGITNAATGREPPSLGTIKFQCSGDWAYATYMSVAGNEIALLLRWNPNKLLGEWEAAPNGACGMGTVPPALAPVACRSGGASATVPTSTPITQPTTGSAAAHCAEADLLRLFNGTPNNVEFWCSGSWAVVHSLDFRDPALMNAYRWNGAAWAAKVAS
jgi:hypothetical protein